MLFNDKLIAAILILLSSKYSAAYNAMVVGLGTDIALGKTPFLEVAVRDMAMFSDEGFNTFDLSPEHPVHDDSDPERLAEEAAGHYHSSRPTNKIHVWSGWSPGAQDFTRTFKRGESLSRLDTSTLISDKLLRIKLDQLQLVQFQWDDYGNPYFFNAVSRLMSLQQQGLIRDLGTKTCPELPLLALLEQDAPITTNQVSFSLLGDSQMQGTVKVAQKHHGGLMSPHWLGRAPPDLSQQSSLHPHHQAQLRRFLMQVQRWGGWGRFQELLHCVQVVAAKYSVSLAAVAHRWVLDQPAVSSIVVTKSERVFDGMCDRQLMREWGQAKELRLDAEDHAVLSAFQQAIHAGRENSATQGRLINMPTLGVSYHH